MRRVIEKVPRLGLSLVFGCLLLALVAELYYLLWWKKRISKGGGEIEDGYNDNSKATDFFHHKSCWRNPSSSSLRSDTQVHEPQVQFHGGDSNKDFWYKPFGEDGDGDDDDDNELMRLQNMAGPTRFLFTIKEETKEDMESEDGKSKDRSRKGSRSRSLSDLFQVVETPYLTPIASPPYFTPPLTPVRTTSYYTSFFGSASEAAAVAEFNWLRSSSSSPPPNFQFLREAENKLHNRKLTDELEIVDKQGVLRNEDSTSMFEKDEDEANGSFITLLVDRMNREEQLHHHLHQNVPQHSPNTTSRVLPLSSSPPPPATPKLTTSSSSSSKSHPIPFPSFSGTSLK